MTDDLFRRIRNKYISCCDDCKRKIVTDAIARAAPCHRKGVYFG